jgi:hypothetical protein
MRIVPRLPAAQKRNCPLLTLSVFFDSPHPNPLPSGEEIGRTLTSGGMPAVSAATLSALRFEHLAMTTPTSALRSPDFA